jgi:predicted transcriptional regulator of viral defense system
MRHFAISGSTRHVDMVGFAASCHADVEMLAVQPGATAVIDALMNHLGRDYYVGWLSAAELHGPAHQRPQVLHVAVDTHTADRALGRVHLRFAQRRHVAALPRERQDTPTSEVWVATTELTALDLADAPQLGGGLNNVATVTQLPMTPAKILAAIAGAGPA